MPKFSDILRNIFYLMLIFTFAQPFLKTIKEFYLKSTEAYTRVGYLEINGIISDSDAYIKQITPFFKDQSIKAIMIKVDSMGGVAGASEALFHEMMELKKEYPKQIVVLVESVCASGAYWVACAGDHIIASPVAWVGSIGAYIPFRFKLKDFINEHHIRYEFTKAGAYKNFTDPFVDTTPEQSAMLQHLCDQTYQEFVQSVASRRSQLSVARANDWANGKVFTGRQALELGLIDGVGSKSNAIAWLKEKAPIEGKIEWVRPPQPGAFASLFGQGSDSEESSSILMHLTDSICDRVEQRYLSGKSSVMA